MMLVVVAIVAILVKTRAAIVAVCIAMAAATKSIMATTVLLIKTITAISAAVVAVAIAAPLITMKYSRSTIKGELQPRAVVVGGERVKTTSIQMEEQEILNRVIIALVAADIVKVNRNVGLTLIKPHQISINATIIGQSHKTEILAEIQLQAVVGGYRRMKITREPNRIRMTPALAESGTAMKTDRIMSTTAKAHNIRTISTTIDPSPRADIEVEIIQRDLRRMIPASVPAGTAMKLDHIVLGMRVGKVVANRIPQCRIITGVNRRQWQGAWHRGDKWQIMVFQ